MFLKVRYYSFSEILTIKEYWNRIGWEPLLAITWQPDFSQACCFRYILMNHRNFHFTQIPDNTNHVIFLKSPVIMFLGYFWPFLVIFARWGFFPKNLAVTHNYIWAPNTMLSFRKKLMSQSRENLQTDGRTDERTDGQNNGRTDRPYFTGSFQPKRRVQKQRKVKKT